MWWEHIHRAWISHFVLKNTVEGKYSKVHLVANRVTSFTAQVITAESSKKKKRVWIITLLIISYLTLLPFNCSRGRARRCQTRAGSCIFDILCDADRGQIEMRSKTYAVPAVSPVWGFWRTLVACHTMFLQWKEELIVANAILLFTVQIHQNGNDIG